MRAKYLILTAAVVVMVVFVSLVSADSDACFYERMAIRDLEERCIFAPCLRRPGPPSNKPMLVKEGPVEEPKQPKSLLSVTETLTHQASKFLRKMSPFLKVMQGIKLVAKFFHTSETSETTEDYWQELADTVQSQIADAIDESIMEKTDAAVKRLSEQLELYINNSNTTRFFSALDLSWQMDLELEYILSEYQGLVKKQRGLLHYLDMATTRLVLWQTTAFRYIADYTIHGQLESGETVCDIVYKWALVYRDETNFIKKDQMDALVEWMNDYVNKMDITCQADCHDPAFHDWDKTITCRVWDGYNAREVYNREVSCDHRSSCPDCDYVCFNICPPSLMMPYLQENQDNYRILNSHASDMLANFHAMKLNYLDKYKEDCGINV